MRAAFLAVTLVLLVPPPALAAGRELLSTVPVNLSRAAVEAGLHGVVHVRARIAPAGVVDTAIAVSGEPRLRRAAEASVRWWVYRPARTRDWVTVSVDVPGPGDVEPIRPDVIALAAGCEARRDSTGAITAWTGALSRLGDRPELRDDWAIREHLLVMARRMKSPPPPPTFIDIHAHNAHALQDHVVAAGQHRDILQMLDEAKSGAPWWSEPYLYEAASQIGSGQLADALRSLRAYRLGSRDSAGLAATTRAFAGIVAGDTLGVCEMLKHVNQSHLEEEPQ